MKPNKTGRLKHMRYMAWHAVLMLLILGSASTAHAYVGPGAGFAFISSFLMFFVAFLLAIVVFLALPIRLLIRLLRRRRAQSKAKCARVVIIGLDGMSPLVVQRLMADGSLPNLAKLARTGTFRRLRSTVPSASPVAWSTFQTGTNPGKHNIFDFLTRNKQTYMPDLASARIQPPRRHLKLGKYRFQLGKPKVSLMRRSMPFWKVLGDHGVFSVVLRVPITFPPEKFRGVILSGMCVPDLRGTQGSFTYFTTETGGNGKHTGGMRIIVQRENNKIASALPGPPNPLDPDAGSMEAPFTVTLDESRGTAVLELAGEKIALQPRRYSPWVRLNFHAGPGANIAGICRFYLTALLPDFKLYVTPINIDPDRPALPLSHPFTYAPYLAKVFGPYATLGLAEDTWALNDHVIDEDAFLEQAYSIHEERETMFFDALDKVNDGMVICVFDTTDRIQHMFWRFTREARASGHKPPQSKHENAVEHAYKRMDEMVGRAVSKLGENDLLAIISDHGFGSFRRCVNLNAWLKENGFLKLKDGATECEGYFHNVDWSGTKAYAVGLGGIFINQMGREAKGIVHEGEEKQALMKELTDRLLGLKDPESPVNVVNRVFDTHKVYTGPYTENAPDLIAGLANGYRVSWDSVVGRFSSAIIEDNEKAWTGDHCIDPDLMAGVLFCNRPVADEDPGIIDIAPTVLDAFGVPIPRYMDGKPLLSWEQNSAGPTDRREESRNHARSTS